MIKQMKIAVLIAAVILTGCQKVQEKAEIVHENTKETTIQTTDAKAAIVYFSLHENTDSDTVSSASIKDSSQGDQGSTAVVASSLQKQTKADIYPIETIQKYPEDFDETVELSREQRSKGTKVEIKEPLNSIDSYDVIYLGYPIWATSLPAAIETFLEDYDLSGKTIIPFCTHDGYGSGSSFEDIAELEPDATVLKGFTLDARDLDQAEAQVAEWLETLGLVLNKSDEKQNALTITIDSHTVNGYLHDTELATEIKDMFPLTVTMSAYGNREYYGSLPREPQQTVEGKRTFENGEITYCPSNNTIAIFYSQSSQPNLTMDVIPIGKVTSDLHIFDELSDSEEMTFSLK